MTVPLNLPATLDAWKGRRVIIATTDGSRTEGVLEDLLTENQHSRQVVAIYFRADSTGEPVIIPWHAVAGIVATDAVTRTPNPDLPRSLADALRLTDRRAFRNEQR